MSHVSPYTLVPNYNECSCNGCIFAHTKCPVFKKKRDVYAHVCAEETPIHSYRLVHRLTGVTLTNKEVVQLVTEAKNHEKY